MTQVTCCNTTRKYSFDHMLKIPSNIREVGKVRNFVSDLLDSLGYAQKEKMNICLSLDEALANAVEHGNLKGQPTVEVGITITPGVCILQVVDFGGYTFNPEYFEKLAEAKDWGFGGRGIFLIKKLMDEVYYFFHPEESTSVVMIKYRAVAGLSNVGINKQSSSG